MYAQTTFASATSCSRDVRAPLPGGQRSRRPQPLADHPVVGPWDGLHSGRGSDRLDDQLGADPCPALQSARPCRAGGPSAPESGSHRAALGQPPCRARRRPHAATARWGRLDWAQSGRLDGRPVRPPRASPAGLEDAATLGVDLKGAAPAPRQSRSHSPSSLQKNLPTVIQPQLQARPEVIEDHTSFHWWPRTA
jgi:hypothetical protein